jgi:immunoglobulin-binding protein 1
MAPQLREAAAALGDRRSAIRSQVFRPGHILPTMTVEQFGELERQRMMDESAAQVRGPLRTVRREREKPGGEREGAAACGE